MKNVLRAAAVLLFATGMASAQQAPSAKKLRPLTERALDTITAGSASRSSDDPGGVLVAGSSEATVTVTGALTISNTAQQDSRALNLVNSSDSAVANAANVWDGRLPEPTTPASPPSADPAGTTTNANGLTDVTADSAKATMTPLNVEQSNLVQQDSARSASLRSYVRTEANVDETSKTTRTITDATSEVNTESVVLGQTIKGGQGFAGAGSADLEITGGSITITNRIEAEVAEGAVGGLTEQSFEWVLPDLSLHVEGVVCAVAMGSCSASGNFSSTSETTKSIRGPVAIRDASAEYIVLDGSSLDVTKDYSVTVNGSAMQNARALNLVNAAGSSIANAVNVSRTPTTAGFPLNLNQVNVVHQTR